MKDVFLNLHNYPVENIFKAIEADSVDAQEAYTSVQLFNHIHINENSFV